MLNIKENDMFKLEGISYITLDSTKYKEETYIFVNELDEKVMRNILSVFSTNMNKKLEVIYEQAMKLKEGAE